MSNNNSNINKNKGLSKIFNLFISKKAEDYGNSSLGTGYLDVQDGSETNENWLNTTEVSNGDGQGNVFDKSHANHPVTPYGEQGHYHDDEQNDPNSNANEIADNQALVDDNHANGGAGWNAGASENNLLRLFKKADDYKGNHRPMTIKQGGARLHELDKSMSDIYDKKNAAHYYGTGDNKLDNNTLKNLWKLKDKPDASVSMFRAVPKNVNNTINHGDWVTINPDYAHLHGKSLFGPGNYQVQKQMATAKDLVGSADSIHEQGFYPETNNENKIALNTLMNFFKKADNNSNNSNNNGNDESNFLLQNSISGGVADSPQVLNDGFPLEELIDPSGFQSTNNNMPHPTNEADASIIRDKELLNKDENSKYKTPEINKGRTYANLNNTNKRIPFIISAGGSLFPNKNSNDSIHIDPETDYRNHSNVQDVMTSNVGRSADEENELHDKETNDFGLKNKTKEQTNMSAAPLAGEGTTEEEKNYSGRDNSVASNSNNNLLSIFVKTSTSKKLFDNAKRQQIIDKGSENITPIKPQIGKSPVPIPKSENLITTPHKMLSETIPQSDSTTSSVDNSTNLHGLEHFIKNWKPDKTPKKLTPEELDAKDSWEGVSHLPSKNMGMYGWIGPKGDFYNVPYHSEHYKFEQALRRRDMGEEADKLYSHYVHVSPEGMKLPSGRSYGAGGFSQGSSNLTEAQVAKLHDYHDAIKKGHLGYVGSAQEQHITDTLHDAHKMLQEQNSINASKAQQNNLQKIAEAKYLHDDITDENGHLPSGNHPWTENVYAKSGKVDMLPIKWLKQFKGNELRPGELEPLQKDIAQNGIKEPLQLGIGQKDRKVTLGEGNHRLQAAENLGITHVPVRGYRMSQQHNGIHYDKMSRVPNNDYFPSDFAPREAFDEWSHLKQPKPPKENIIQPKENIEKISLLRFFIKTSKQTEQEKHPDWYDKNGKLKCAHCGSTENDMRARCCGKCMLKQTKKADYTGLFPSQNPNSGRDEDVEDDQSKSNFNEKKMSDGKNDFNNNDDKEFYDSARYRQKVNYNRNDNDEKNKDEHYFSTVNTGGGFGNEGDGRNQSGVNNV